MNNIKKNILMYISHEIYNDSDALYKASQYLDVYIYNKNIQKIKHDLIACKIILTEIEKDTKYRNIDTESKIIRLRKILQINLDIILSQNIKPKCQNDNNYIKEMKRLMLCNANSINDLSIINIALYDIIRKYTINEEN